MQSRDELEFLWRKRVSEARERYVSKTNVCKSLLAEGAESFPITAPDPNGTLALHQALQRESDALQEYMRVLNIFTALVFQGTMPPNELADACGVLTGAGQAR